MEVFFTGEVIFLMLSKQ